MLFIAVAGMHVLQCVLCCAMCAAAHFLVPIPLLGSHTVFVVLNILIAIIRSVLVVKAPPFAVVSPGGCLGNGFVLQ